MYFENHCVFISNNVFQKKKKKLTPKNMNMVNPQSGTPTFMKQVDILLRM